MSSVVVSLEHVGIHKDGVDILSDVSVAFPDSRTTVIMGPSGCGKSILLKVAALLIQPDSGQVIVNGRDAESLSVRDLFEFRRVNGFVFQDGALWQNMSAMDNVSLPLRLHFPHLDESEIERRVRSLVDKVGFWDSMQLRPSKLSTGEQKMLSLIRALVTDPAIIFLDSPTLSLDSESAKNVFNILKDLKRRERTMIISTHDPVLTSLLADYLVIMNRGKLLTCGIFSEVVRNTDREITGILTEVLSKTSTYDDDILDLLGKEE